MWTGPGNDSKGFSVVPQAFLEWDQQHSYSTERETGTLCVWLQSMYIRVKRKKTTVFLAVEPTDTVLEVKQKLETLISKVRRRQ